MSTVFIPPTPRSARLSRTPPSRRRSAGEIEHAIDLQHHQQLAVEPEDAAGNLAPLRIEGRRVGFVALGRQAQDLADGVDDQAVELARMLDDDAHALAALGARLQ